MIRFGLIALALLIASSSFAADEGGGSSKESEFFYQPNGGQTSAQLSYVTTTPTSYSISTKAGVKVADVSAVVQSFAFQLGYGVTDDFSVGLLSAYNTSKSDVTYPASTTRDSYKSVGPTDLSLVAQERMASDSVTTYLGLKGSFSLAKGKQSTSTADGTNYSGGWALTPALGVMKVVNGGFKVGAQLKYTLNGDRVKDSNTTPEADITYKGGNALLVGGVVENTNGPTTFNLSVAIESTESAQSTQSGVTTTTDAVTDLQIEANLAYHANPNLTVLGGALLQSVPEMGVSSSTKLASYTETAFTVGARLVF